LGLGLGFVEGMGAPAEASGEVAANGGAHLVRVSVRARARARARARVRAGVRARDAVRVRVRVRVRYPPRRRAWWLSLAWQGRRCGPRCR